MAALPDQAYLGDSLEFTATVDSGSTGKAYFKHVDSGDLVGVDLVVSGTTATATLDPTKTANGKSGIYSVSLVLETDGDRETVSIGRIKLLTPVDRPAVESHARKMVRLLQMHLEGRIDDGQGRGLETYTVGGVPITKIAFRDAKALLNEYRRDLDAETVKARSEAGLGTGRRILTTFE